MGSKIFSSTQHMGVHYSFRNLRTVRRVTKCCLSNLILLVVLLCFSLQFLSMKLASLNPPLDYNLDTILNREVLQLQHHFSCSY
jgi:hypothetical protein